MSLRQNIGEGSVYPAPAARKAKEMGAVHMLRFSTPDPLDHFPRALDVVRRMGFDFVSVWAQPAPSARFLVRLNFVPNGDKPPSSLANRISAFIGVTDVELSIV